MIFSLIIASLPFAGGAVTMFGLSPAISAALINAGKALLWGQVNKALAPKTPAQQVQASIAQATAPRVRGYGTFLLGGVRVLREAKAGKLYQITAAHHGPISQVLHFEVNGEAVTLAAGVVSSGSAAGRISIDYKLSGDGGDYAAARAAFPAIWTVDHRLADQASYLTVLTAPKLSELSRVFPRQAETSIAMVANLSPVIDPRTGITAFSDLTGPAVYDYLTHADGYRIPAGMIDLASFASFTTICDQSVPLHAGGAEKRWRIGGFYTLEDAPKDVMARLLMTADAQLYMTPEGKCGILGGRWAEPDVTIGADDILSVSLTDGFDEFSDFNVLKGKFTSPNHRFQEVEVDELADAVSLETQPLRVATLTADMCPSATQMRRLMYLYRAKNIRRWQGSIRTNLVGLKARFPRGDGPHVIRVVMSELGIDRVFEVVSHSYSITEKACEIGIASLDNAYVWNPATQEGAPPLPLADLPAASAVDPVPAGLLLSQEIVLISTVQNGVRIVALVSPAADQSLQLQAQIRAAGAVDWEAMIVAEGDERAYSGIVTDGVAYEVRVKYQGHTTYAATASITAVSNPIAPAPATGLSIAYAVPNITLSWVNGVSGYSSVRVYRGASAIFADAVVIVPTLSGLAGAAQTYDDAPGVGTWYYWVVSVNASAIEALTKTGPVSQTI